MDKAPKSILQPQAEREAGKVARSARAADFPCPLPKNAVEAPVMPAVAEREEVVEVISKGGRPSLYSPTRVKAIVGAVKRGLSPTRAAAFGGIIPETLSEWRVRYPEFSEKITRAESEFVLATAEKLSKAKTMAGSADPKALELLLRRFPEFRQVQEIETRNTNLSLSLTLDATQIAQLQQMWSGQAIEDTK